MPEFDCLCECDSRSVVHRVEVGETSFPTSYTPMLLSPSLQMMPMTKEMKQRIAALTRLQNAHETITQEFEKEVRELERKYHKRYQPLYESRTAIISGAQEPTGEEGEPDSEEDDEDLNEDDEGAGTSSCLREW